MDGNEAEYGKEFLRIIQETVPGRQITLAHIIAKPREIVYRKLGLDPKVDYNNSAIGLLTMSPAEMAIIASDIASKSGNVELGFVDRFSGTLIFTGSISNVEMTLKAILDYTGNTLKFSVCHITRT
jgi:ethanolamine utilization protein EutS